MKNTFDNPDTASTVHDNEYYLSRQSQMESNVRSYPRKLPLAIVKAQGCWLSDANGKKYLDCLAGAGTLALGHNHPAIIESIQTTLASGLPLHSLDLTTPLKDAFSEALLKILPRAGEDYVLQFCGPSGADAIEAAIKLAKTYTGRRSVISFSGGYHGMTHGALSLTGNLSAKNEVSGLMPDVQFMPYPHEYRCPLGIGGDAGIDALGYYFEQFIEDVESGVTRPAAVVLEAIQGEGGVVVAPDRWLKRIREVTAKHDIVLILDEVQAGFARSGKMFAFEHSGIEPDIIVMSKAVGGSLPLAVLGIKRQFDAWQPAGHTGTFRGNQMAMGTGLASLKVIAEQNLAAHAEKQGQYLQAELRKIQQRHGCIGNIRGRGLMLGVEIVDETQAANHLGAYPGDGALAAAIQTACFNHGLLLEKGGRGGAVIRLLCPLIINDEECAEMVKRFSAAIDDALVQMRGC